MPTDKITTENLNAKLVYDLLDKSEGKGKVGDKKLEAQTWNIFLEKTGLKGKPIKNSIFEDKKGKSWGAVASLKSYLKKADITTKQKIVDYLEALNVDLNTSKAKAAVPAKTSDKKEKKVNEGLAKYNENMSAEAKAIKPDIKKLEGEKPQTYIAPEGKSTVGHGHLLTDKPAFLQDIESSKKVITVNGKEKTVSLTPKEKADKMAKALETPANKTALKKCLEANLEKAAKNTGITTIALTVGDDLKLTDEQMELLLNSDIKNAEDKMKEELTTDVLDKRTTNQKKAALDLYYNLGSLNTKAPNFVKYFKEGDMTKAACELDINKANGVRLKGLIRRNYERAKLLFEDGKLPDDVKNAILKEYNAYLTQKNQKTIASFEDFKKDLGLA